jgi:hypothetical protein
VRTAEVVSRSECECQCQYGVGVCDNNAGGDDQGHGRGQTRTEAQLRREAPPAEGAQNRGTATVRTAEVVSECECHVCGVGDCDDDDTTNDTDGAW